MKKLTPDEKAKAKKDWLMVKIYDTERDIKQVEESIKMLEENCSFKHAEFFRLEKTMFVNTLRFLKGIKL